MPTNRNTPSPLARDGGQGRRRDADDPRDAFKSDKEARIRKAAERAGERKDWGGVARRGATWLDREGPSVYGEPERSAPEHVSEKWVLDEPTKSKRSGGQKRERKRAGVSDEAVKEVTKIAGKQQASRMLRYLEEAATAYSGERWRDAERAIKPLLDNIPDAPVVIELNGLIQYRTGKWAKAIVDLEMVRKATGSDQLLPAIMDCYRARKKYAQVEELWAELCDASPDAETMADGRIVVASAIAEQGDVEKAIKVLKGAPKVRGKTRLHHIRIWYVLADLYERAGDVVSARRLFRQVADHDPELADVLDRLDALG